MNLRILSLAVAAAACGAPAAPPAAPARPAPAAPEAAVTAAVSDRQALAATARLLAGLPGEQETDRSAPAGGGADGEVWARHAALMAQIWGQVEARHLMPMRTWAEAQLSLAAPGAPLFYPFSGPDLPSALQLFPAASSYVLVGLEPPGRIPDLGGPALEAELERLRGGLESLANAGYFVTKRMESDFAASRLGGLLPVLYLFLARAGLTPVAVELIGLDGDGAIVPLPAATERTATAVRIRFSDGRGAEDRSLCYFSQDLSNAGLAAAPEFTAFVRRLGSFNVYLKSASYLLHMDDFTAQRELLTGHAGTVLQDDSGIPLRALPARDWRLRFFGTYSRTLPAYREWFQPELKAVYDQGGVPALPFAVGYHSKIGGSCLILAERRGE